MNHLYLKMPIYGVLAVSMAMLTGCVDDKYDLSDVDTNVAVSVDNLTLPINLDVVKLSSIITLNDDSRIKIIDGEYAITEEGTFDSDPIKIASFSAPAPTISPVRENINLSQSSAPAGRASQNMVFAIGGFYSDYNYTANGIDNYIIDITSAQVDMTMNMSLRVSASGIGSYRFKNLVLQFPEGLVATPSVGTYDPSTGELHIADLAADGNSAKVSLTITKLMFGNESIRFDGDKHEFVFKGQVGIKECDIEVTELTGVLTTGSLNIDFDFGHIDVTAVSGIIDYSLDGMAIDPVNLTDLPDFLSQNQTNIVLVNPQIYVSLNNPLTDYRLKAQAGLSITPVRGGVAGRPALLDNGVFDINAVGGQLKYCMAPSKPSAMPTEYKSAEYVGYKSLSDVLEGNGLPQQLNIEIVNACVPRQTVSDFKLGVDIDKIRGRYMLLAPLALNEGSQIVYTDTENGWNDETLDDLVVTDLTLKFTASTDVPMGVTITGYPIDVNGRQIDGVEIEGATLNANADEQEVVVHMKGEITGLDGVTFTAVTSSAKDATSLRPDQTIDLKNIRVTVSGYYSKEL